MYGSKQRRKLSWNKGLTLMLVGAMLLTYLVFNNQQSPLSSAHAKSLDSKLLHNTLTAKFNPNRPVLAFYYPWYNTRDWCLCRMPDLPTIRYNSADDATLERQIHWAADAGITGFISSWWGAGDQTDTNFAKLLQHAEQLKKKTGVTFASSLYFEGDAPRLKGTSAIVNNLKYIVAHYSASPYFFHWQGKPVIFIWNPVGNGRSLSQWQSIRQQVDPAHRLLWSAEGTDMRLLDVFDGIHLFSAGYWGLLHGNMAAVDQDFRNQVNAYNASHGTHKIWAAGVMPGYDDTHVRGRTGTFKVPRNNGATYRTSWNAATGSAPEWVTITSFSEWFEGSMLEPSVTYNMQYLSLTHQYATAWHG